MIWSVFLFLLYREQWCTKHFLLNQCCHYSSCLLCCVIHYCSTGWCCGTLLCCEEEMWLSEVLLSDNSSQAAAATTSTSVWGHCWPVTEHWTEGECRIWSCAAVDYSKVLLMRCFMCIELAITVLHYCDHSAHTIDALHGELSQLSTLNMGFCSFSVLIATLHGVLFTLYKATCMYSLVGSVIW